MRVKQVTIGKKLLTNIGKFSNIEVSHYEVIEFEEGEEPNYEGIYDRINSNLQIESDSLDVSWIKRDELKDAFKLTIYLPKRGGERG